jgi:hypothetical protein
MQSAARWVPLRHYLKLQHARRQDLQLGFRQIEAILGDGLPKPARKYPAWWANDPANEQAHTWLDVGWLVTAVDLQAEEVRLEHAASTAG